jgi:hypothetical protein
MVLILRRNSLVGCDIHGDNHAIDGLPFVFDCGVYVLGSDLWVHREL